MRISQQLCLVKVIIEYFQNQPFEFLDECLDATGEHCLVPVAVFPRFRDGGGNSSLWLQEKMAEVGPFASASRYRR